MTAQHKKSIAIIKRRGVPRGLMENSVDGGTLNLLETVSAFTNTNLSIDVFTTSEDTHQANVELLGPVTIHRIPCSKSWQGAGLKGDYIDGLEFAEALLRYPDFTSRQFTYCHTHHWSSVLPSLLEHIRRVEVHAHTPHLLAIEKARFLGCQLPGNILESEGATLKSADVIIALSNSEKRSMETHYGIPTSRIRVIPNGVSDLFVTGSKSPFRSITRSRHFEVVSIGRICRQKGFDILVRAVAGVRDRGIPIHCTIIGPQYYEHKYERELHLMGKELHIDSHVTFVGPQPRHLILEYLKKADCYVQTSRYESQGIALAEAMATGLPVIVTRTPALCEMVADGINGFVVGMEDYLGITNALITIQNNSDLIEGMSRTNSAFAKRLTWSKTRRETLKCFLGENDKIAI
jgi:glycosyltransferase involved in cell wall biosynthesis